MKTVLCGSSQGLLVEPSTKTFVWVLLYIHHHNDGSRALQKLEVQQKLPQHQRDYLILNSCT